MKIDIGNCQEKLKSLLCSKDDPNYGKPDKNSASAMRAAAGEAKMRGEICGESRQAVYRRVNLTLPQAV